MVSRFGSRAGDLDLAVQFLDQWEPDGPWLLTAIHPDSRAIETQRFDDPTLMRSWLERHQGQRNIYFSVNRVRPGINGRAKKEDIAAALAQHVDLDPPKDAQQPDLAAAQATLLDKLTAYEPPPSVIIFSGGGYQGFWLFDEPVVTTEASQIADIEARNLAIAQQLGADHCHNIDRIMRLPGTINLPDARKRALGRTAVAAELVFINLNRRYRLEDFPPAGSGDGDGKKTNDKSRSAAAFRKGAALRRAGATYEEMVEALRQDPETADWVREKGEPNNERELRRIWEKAAPDAARPIVQIITSKLPAVIDTAETILIENDPDLYEFADQVMRLAPAPIRIADNRTIVAMRLVPVRLYHILERFSRVIEFQKYSKLEKKWLPADCPEVFGKTYLERVGRWHLPKLTALTACPMLLGDGRIVDRPGFDPDSGILFDPQGTTFPPIPACPTFEDARLALAYIKSLYAEFPFVDDTSRSVLLSALLTSVSRLAFDFVPLHGFDAPVAGTGKSKLVDSCSILVNGHECPVISQGEDETEFEKRLGAELLEGARFISIDNCEAPLGGALLCQITTQRLVKVRVLGLSKTVMIVNGALVFATGNNLRLSGDMLRRGLICRLDAGEERPELRTFNQQDPVHVLKRARGGYVVAALTVLRAFILAGRPGTAQPLGGFEGWSTLVRNALLWLGEADPILTLDTARAEDPDRLQLEAVITWWWNVFATDAVTARQVAEKASSATTVGSGTAQDPQRLVYAHPDLRNALLDIAGERGGISTIRLGKWLGLNKHKVVGDRRIAAASGRSGTLRWRLQQRDADGNWQ